MPLDYLITIFTFVFSFFTLLCITSYKFAQLELKKERLALSREIFENMAAHNNDDDDDDDSLAELFSRPAPDPSIIGKL
jgi:hypothetical protein